MPYKVIVWLSYVNWVFGANYKIVLLAEKAQPEIAGWFGDALRDAEAKAPQLKVEDESVLVDRDDEDATYEEICSVISQPISLIVDMSWSPWERLPLVAPPLIRTTLGDSAFMLDALLQMLAARGAADAVLIFQTEQAMDQALYRLLNRSVLRILAISSLQDRLAQLTALRPVPGHFVIIGTTAFAQETYKLARTRGLINRPDRWSLLLTDLRSSRLDVSQLRSTAHVLSLSAAAACRLQDKQEPCSAAEIPVDPILMAGLTKLVLDALIDADPQGATRHTSQCTAPAKGAGESATWTTRFYKSMAYKTNGNDSLFRWDPESFTLTPRLELLLQAGGKAGLRAVTKWTSGESLKTTALTSPRAFYYVGTSFAIPWTYQKKNANTGALLYNSDGTPMLEGYCIDLIKRLAEHLDFDYEIVLPKTDGFGKKLPNGTWTGLIGDLTTGVTDIAVAATIMTSQREEVVDFVAPYFEQTGISIVIRKPMRQTSLFKFMTVLRPEVWLSVVAALGLTACLLSLLDRYSPYSARNRKEAYPYPCREFTLKESLWFALTSFTPQGGGEAPKALSARALVAAYWLFVVLMLATFTANLAAFLTVERMQSPVSSLEQLAKQSRINYTVAEASTAQKYFINMKHAEDTLYRVWKEITLNASADQVLYQVWDYPVREQYGHILLAINLSVPVPTPEHGFRKADERLDADFAFIHDSSEIKYQVTLNCNLTEVGEVFGERPFALAVQQGSRLQEQLSRALLGLQKDRFMEQLRAKYWNASLCPDNEDKEGITLDSLGGVFIATLFGLALAMTTLAWEILYYKRKEKKNGKVRPLDDKPPKYPGNKDHSRHDCVKRVTIGDTFRPVHKPKVSYIDVTKGAWNP